MSETLIAERKRMAELVRNYRRAIGTGELCHNV
jgi:hypothetical protein